MKRRKKKSVIWWHQLLNDWCHICGVRSDKTADIWFPENAEHDTRRTRYIRICYDCSQEIARAALGEIQPYKERTFT